ncbi:response regulator [Segetibacter aerophilus]|uniref:Response regulatory domain-containing protein n=1 Tax=Segetibacter aerophilus TaxID=670293 RepID=A0A512BBZ6_9BACT|nr:response regulator [Segetibacter aerophilus]GEO09493.1 hypothetical protein SAE01_19890 [Segetibacter aerophilus]
MKTAHPILIIEDDLDDCELIVQALADIGIQNERKCFEDGEKALRYLQTTSEKTFLILSDLSMPLLNGLELKKQINKDEKLRTQSIPFVFLTTSNSKKDILEAYNLLAQGFFTKPNDYRSLITLLRSVTHYWDIAQHPS